MTCNVFGGVKPCSIQSNLYFALDLHWTDKAEALQCLSSWLSPTTDHAANMTSHCWQPFIPCDGGTGMEQSST